MRDGPHHQGKAAVRLQIAGHIRHKLVGRCDRHAADRQRCTAHFGIGLADIQMDPLPQKIDALACPFRIGRDLPFGRRLTFRIQIQCDMVDGIFGSDARKIGDPGGKFRIETDVDADRLVIKFHIAKHWDFRPYVVEIEHLAPPVMADDDVRLVTELFQIRGGTAHGVGTPHRGVELAGGDVCLGCGGRRFGIGNLAHAIDGIVIRFCNEHDLVLACRDQMPDDVQELAREVLVDKQESHAATLCHAGDRYRRAGRAAALARVPRTAV